MRILMKTTQVEAKLFLREPMSVLFGVLFPTALLLGLGALPVLRESSEDFDGARFVDIFAPTALVLGLGIIALQHVPAVVAAYRQNGILRRMSTTPVHPATVLVAHLLVALGAAVAAAVLLIGSAWLVLDVPPPQHPLLFIVAFLVGFGAVLAIAMLIAAVAPNPAVGNGLGMAAWFVVMFAGGVFLPRFLMPDFLVRMGDYTPPGVQALLDAWSGDEAIADAVGGSTSGPQLLQLGIMALVAVVAGTAAARFFRWE